MKNVQFCNKIFKTGTVKRPVDSAGTFYKFQSQKITNKIYGAKP